nr:triple gene block protein 1 [Strawberry mild yellow edge virus]
MTEYTKRLLLDRGFERTNRPIAGPIVVHAVAGAGKSSLINTVSLTFQLICWTTLPEEKASFNCLHLRHLDGPAFPGAFIDEYQLADTDLSEAAFLFGDPLQYPGPAAQVPHFVKLFSHRCGQNSASLIRELGIAFEASKLDSVQYLDPYSSDPEGTILAFVPEVQTVLARHSLEFLCLDEFRGKQWPTCTLYVSTKHLCDLDRPSVYVALTRHYERLLIMSFDAADPTA